ncbi:MAG: hypothetical protein RLZZ535_693 [Cyanobacteriota bacterium]
MRNDKERLRDILEAISQIEKYAIQGQTEFQNNELIQVWVVHHLQIIGEAANSLSQKMVTQHSRVPWSQIIAFRNILVHEYFRVDLKAVWKIIERDLPNLKNKVVDILNNK